MFNKIYNISFVTNGGKEIDPISCKSKKEFPELPVPVKDGYKFMGWFVNEETNILCEWDKMPKKDIVLYAKWENINLEEFAKEIDFFTKSSNILQNLQNDYEGVPNFKDLSNKDTKTTKKKATSKTNKKTTKKKTVSKTSKKVKENKAEENVTNEVIEEVNE